MPLSLEVLSTTVFIDLGKRKLSFKSEFSRAQFCLSPVDSPLARGPGLAVEKIKSSVYSKRCQS